MKSMKDQYEIEFSKVKTKLDKSYKSFVTSFKQWWKWQIKFLRIFLKVWVYDLNVDNHNHWLKMIMVFYYEWLIFMLSFILWTIFFLEETRLEPLLLTIRSQTWCTLYVCTYSMAKWNAWQNKKGIKVSYEWNAQ